MIKTYTVKDVADILHIGKNKAYALMKSQGFPAVRLNRTLIVREDMLDKWLSQNTGKQYCF